MTELRASSAKELWGNLYICTRARDGQPSVRTVEVSLSDSRALQRCTPQAEVPDRTPIRSCDGQKHAQVPNLGKMELQWVIRAQADIQADLEEVGKGVPLVRQEQCVVAQRAHREADLLQIEQILQRGNLPQEDPVGDGVCC